MNKFIITQVIARTRREVDLIYDSLSLSSYRESFTLWRATREATLPDVW